MNDFKNKYYVDLFILTLIILIAILSTDKYSLEVSIISSLSILLCCTFNLSTMNLKSILTKQETILSTQKQKVYIIISLSIIGFLFFYNYEYLELLLFLPIVTSFANLVSSLIFKETEK